MLIKMTGTMPERKHVLYDLDMPRLLSRMLPELSEEQACLFLQEYLCRDSAEITERSLLLTEFADKSGEDELAECITLEEWESELTKIIHEHYQSNHESHSQPHCKN